MVDKAISVKQLNLYVKSLLESDANLSYISVIGEISNFKSHYSSGHWYFTLKDSDALINCIMFKQHTLKVNFIPQNGMRIILKGRVSLYERDGQYQFYAENMQIEGEGDILHSFLEVKEKLQKEGLFDETTKRKLPKYPKKIAVITSDNGAAVKDITNILARRYPLSEVVLCAVNVQGALAAKTMVAMLEKVYELSDIDVIIIGRGGGSAEDLNSFNDELLARKIYESPVPVISAVGHETDFTISDFVADVRASTPSAAAELAVPDVYDLFSKIKTFENSIIKAVTLKHSFLTEKLKNYNQFISLKFTSDYVNGKVAALNNISNKIKFSVSNIYSKYNANFQTAVAKLDASSPLKILKKGYAIPTKDGITVKSVKEINLNDTVFLRFVDGSAKCSVLNLEEKENQF